MSVLIRERHLVRSTVTKTTCLPSHSSGPAALLFDLLSIVISTALDFNLHFHLGFTTILDVKGLIEELNEFIILLDLTTLLLNLLLGLQCTNKGGLGIIDGGLAECKG